MGILPDFLFPQDNGREALVNSLMELGYKDMQRLSKAFPVSLHLSVASPEGHPSRR